MLVDLILEGFEFYTRVLSFGAAHKNVSFLSNSRRKCHLPSLKFFQLYPQQSCLCGYLLC